MSPSTLLGILSLSKDKRKGHPRMWCAPERVEWLPVTNDLRTISVDYDRYIDIKVKKPEKMKHIIHKAVKWKKMLDDGSAESMSEIARIEGLTRARVTQIMNLLKLPAEMQVFLLELNDGKQIRKYSERKLRGYHE